MRGFSCWDLVHARQAAGLLEVLQLWQARAEMLLLHWRGRIMLPLTQPSAVGEMFSTFAVQKGQAEQRHMR
jgi:hypothetical protein